MQFSVAIRLLSLLKHQAEEALTIQKIITKWNDVYDEEMNLRRAQSYMKALSKDEGDAASSLVIRDRARGQKEYVYFLRVNQVAQLFMDPNVAFQHVLAQQALQNSFGTNVKEVAMDVGLALEMVDKAAKTRRWRQRIAVVPDGVGRLRASIEPRILLAVLDALGANHCIAFTYKNAGGHESSKEVSPLGLVAKDGTLYLIGKSKGGDKIIHYALQRVSQAHVTQYRADSSDDFNLEDYIVRTDQFSHALGETEKLELALRVAKKTLYHFQERPFNASQEIMPMEGSSTDFRVTARVVDNFLLVPFLASMGAGVEVLGPPQVRQKLGEFIRGMSDYYAEKT